MSHLTVCIVGRAILNLLSQKLCNNLYKYFGFVKIYFLKVKIYIKLKESLHLIK